MGSSNSTDKGTKRKADEDVDGESPAKKTKNNDGKAKGKAKGKAAAPFSWEDFHKHAKPLEVKFGDSKDVRSAAVKKFSTGSYGWAYHGNEVLTADGKDVAVRVGLNITIQNSKPGGDGKKEKEADEEDNEKSDASTSKKWTELSKLPVPFADAKAFTAVADNLLVKLGSAGAAASADSIVKPFEVTAAAKAFAPGSFGWAYHANKKIEAAESSNGEHGVESVTVRVSLNITVFNSKPASAPKKAAGGKGKGKGKGKKAKAAAADDADADA